MANLKQELEAVRAEMKKRPIDQFKTEILELIDVHNASQQEVVRWLDTYKGVKVTQPTLSRRLTKWKS